MLTTQAELDKYSLNSIKTAKGKFTPASVFLNCKASLPWLFFFFCSGFCHTLKWNSHGFTCVPHPDPPSHLPLPWLLLSSWSRRKLVLGRNLACPGVRRGHPRALISVYLVNGAYPMEMQVEGVEGKPSGCITSTPCSWMAKRHE